MENNHKIGHNYKDILSVFREQDQFVSWFSFKESGIGSSGSIRAAKYLNLDSHLPCYIVLITRNISHRWYDPWEDMIDCSTGYIFYWGDAKFDNKKSSKEFKGNEYLQNVFDTVLENILNEMPPILHFSKIKSGLVKFNGLCALTNLELTWFKDKGNPVKNYRCELTILDSEEVKLSWLHNRVNYKDQKNLNQKTPGVWRDYVKGNIRKLDVWSKRICSKGDQLPPEKSRGDTLLKVINKPTQFEALVVELFRNLPHVNHETIRTRSTADGGFDFYGPFPLPYPIRYEIEFLGEAKKFSRNNAVQPKYVSRLVARLNRGQYGLFVTTSYCTRQTQKEVLEDGYPVKLFFGNDLINILHELRLVDNERIKKDWLEAVTKKIS